MFVHWVFFIHRLTLSLLLSYSLATAWTSYGGAHQLSLRQVWSFIPASTTLSLPLSVFCWSILVSWLIFQPNQFCHHLAVLGGQVRVALLAHMKGNIHVLCFFLDFVWNRFCYAYTVFLPVRSFFSVKTECMPALFGILLGTFPQGLLLSIVWETDEDDPFWGSCISCCFCLV